MIQFCIESFWQISFTNTYPLISIPSILARNQGVAALNLVFLSSTYPVQFPYYWSFDFQLLKKLFFSHLQKETFWKCLHRKPLFTDLASSYAKSSQAECSFLQTSFWRKAWSVNFLCRISHEVFQRYGRKIVLVTNLVNGPCFKEAPCKFLWLYSLLNLHQFSKGFHVDPKIIKFWSNRWLKWQWAHLYLQDILKAPCSKVF